MNISLKKTLPHIAVLIGFVVISLLYFNPVLSGKQIYQSDIVQYTAMSKQQSDYRNEKGQEPYWTDSAFGGMPTYQLGARYPHNYIKKLDSLIRFLPRPADYLFLYFLGFYLLLLVLKVDWRLAVIGALAFGFSTYLIIILGVGHNAKAHAIGYFPWVLAGIVLTFQKKYIPGFLLTAVAMALEIQANHIQMTYYLGLLVLVLGVAYLIDAYKKQILTHFFRSVGILLIAVVLGVITNATGLLATKEYADWSTRGKTELTLNPDGTPKELMNSGLSKSYITEYSYGIAESMNLLVPRLFGGSNSENIGKKSNTYEFLIEQGFDRNQAKDFVSGLPLYWGAQPIVAAPAYVGAVIVFLFVLGLFLVKGRLKWWLVGGTVLSLLLSWGKNFEILTNFMIDYFPMYDKFRAVSSIQVLLELCMPILAVFTLVRVFNEAIRKEEKLTALKWSFSIVFGLGLLLLLGKGMFDFVGSSDGTLRQYYGNELLNVIVEDRKMVYTQDLIRSLLLVLATAALLLGFITKRIKETYVILFMGILILIDLVGIDRRYVNENDFVGKRKMEQPFRLTQTDEAILSDKGHYRVFNVREGLNGASTSYFHKSIGGYHAAKPRALQELFEYQVSKNNLEPLNMLNVKYFIQPGEKGQPVVIPNSEANGNAWFVKEVQTVLSRNEELFALDSLNTRRTALVNAEDFNTFSLKDRYQTDSTASIVLKGYEPNKLEYISNNKYDGLAVFSEVYYPKGWKVHVDGEAVDHFRADYALRALRIPAGKHEIVFSFEPQVIKKGTAISLAGNITLLLLIVGGLFYEIRKNKR